MFFRRRPVKELTFEQRIDGLRQAGFAVEPGGAASFTIRRHGCAAVVSRTPEGLPAVVRIGVVVADQIAELVDGGYQKFFETSLGPRRPARAADLTALHAFQEDLYEALGLESLYNLSLGTVFDRHDYDRLQGRPQG